VTSPEILRPEPHDDGHLTFVVTGDGRPTLAHMPYPQHAVMIMREISLLQPEFVLYTGDAFWHYWASRQEMLNDFDRFRALADSGGVPLYNAPGNHEMQSDPEVVAMLEEKGHDLYGSFDVGPYHFIALNTDEVNLEGRVTGEQLDWLRWDLERSRDALAKFVFMHRPLHSWFQGDFNPDDAEALHDLFRCHHVRGVFAAHDHFFHHERHDGVDYMTVGGGGGPLYAQPPRGGFAHYVIVRAGPGGVDYNVVEPGHLEVDYTAGNDGLEPVTVVRVMNSTDRDLLVRALRLRVPRLASDEDYELALDYLDWQRQRSGLPLSLRSVEDNGDGSATLVVQAPVPRGSAFRIIAEARP
jgi:hypothetical protein